MDKSVKDSNNIIDIAPDGNSIIEDIIDIFTSTVPSGLINDSFDSNDSDWLK